MCATSGTSDKASVLCTIKLLERSEWEPAAARAIEENPSNAPMVQMLTQAIASDNVIPPAHLALLTAKYWRTGGVRLTVSFLDDPPADLRARILSHMNAWSIYANVEFVQVASDGQVRIARKKNDGHWSYLGTDVLSVDKSNPTMNLDSFTMDTPEKEFRRVVRHETGHTLGFPHEHMTKDIVQRIDERKAIDFYEVNQGWPAAEIYRQILTPSKSSALIATATPDPTSIMCYDLPAEIMKDGVAVPGGIDINATDGKLVGRIYPKISSWQLLNKNHTNVSVVADSTDLYTIDKTGFIWQYTGTVSPGWIKLNMTPATKKATASNGKLYQLHNTGKIWEYTGTPITGWKLLDNNNTTTDIIADGNDLYQLRSTGHVWKYTGTPSSLWYKLNLAPATIKIISSGGNLCLLHNNGAVYRYTGVPLTGWQKLDDNPTIVDIVAYNDDLYQLHNSGKICKYTGAPLTGSEELDDNKDTKQIVAGPCGLFKIHKNGEIWSYVGPPKIGWKQLDANPSSDSIVAGNSLYQLHKTGLVSRYMG
ncbi:hypothetical protein FSARC_11171 [Fusarium sarcochroum]|uniref:Peptidase metallopeptidase domain-containing protein n=1 Tax=Fusarium sarcochroum TaxID=1208366 RepID=A0A8H4X1J4_9HYPO|nr:hypothetical protein FSARC_11171 [Fusarium sarcochroum]